MISPPGMTEAELAVAVEMNASRIRARRVLDDAAAVTIGVPLGGPNEQAAELRIAAGDDRGQVLQDMVRAQTQRAASRGVDA